MGVTPDQVNAGQAVYTRRTLNAYDLIVLAISNRWIWKCPTPGLVEHYNRHVSAQHLDVGVGTGYFLDRCRFPTATPRVTLMDLNPETLAYASQRIARYRPETCQRNVLEPIAYDGEPFESVGVNYLLHCLPGTIASKSATFDHLRPLLKPGAVVFGSTLLQGGVERGAAAKRLMAFYNSKGIFGNEHDDLAGLDRELRKRFDDVRIDVVGCAAVFSARA